MNDMTNRPAWWGDTERAAATAQVDSELLWKAHGATPPALAEGDWNYLAQAHPDLGLSNPDDPAQRYRALAFRMHAANSVLQAEVPRDLNQVDQYLGLRVGPEAAPDIAKARADTPLHSVVPQDLLAADPQEFEGVQTVGQYRAKIAQKVGVADYVDTSPTPVAPTAPTRSAPFSGRANYATLDNMGDPSTPEWQQKNLTTIRSGNGQEWQVHSGAAQAFQGLIKELEARGVSLKSDGGFNYRNIRGGTQLSQHAWGNAIDINADDNEMGSHKTTMPSDIKEIAAKYGLIWGGTFKRPDPMHFEWAGPEGVSKGPSWLTTAQSSEFGGLERQFGLAKNTMASGAELESGGRAGLRDTGNKNMGLFQFEPSDMAEHGQSNPLDPRQSAIAYATEASKNKGWLTSVTGREPDAGDYYVAHQQGPTGSKALLQNPDMPAWKALVASAGSEERAKAKIQRNIPGDSPLANKPVDQITAKEFTTMWHDRAMAVSVGISDTPMNTGTNMPTSQWDQRQVDYDRRKGEYSLAGAALEAAKHESAVGWLLEGARVPPADPNWAITSTGLKQDDRLKDVPADYQHALLDSTSKADYERKLAVIRDQMQYEQKLGEMGGTGMALRMFGAAVDPAGWLLSSASPLAVGAKAGKIARIFTSGANMAIGAGFAEIPQALENPLYEKHQVLAAAAGGFVFGAGVGHFLHAHPAIQAKLPEIAAQQESLANDISNAAPMKVAQSSTGAAEALHSVADVRTDTADWVHQSVIDREVGKGALTAARLDVTGKLLGSENPVTAAMGGRLAEDGVGRGDHSAAYHAVSVEQRMIQQRFQTQLAASFDASFRDYADRNGIGFAKKLQARKDFAEMVADYIDSVDRIAAEKMDPAAKRFAEDSRKMLDAYHDLGQNPGLIDGSIRKALPGLADVPKNELYFPHVYDFQKFREIVGRVGDSQMIQGLKESILSHLPELVPGETEGFVKAQKAYDDAMGKHAVTKANVEKKRGNLADRQATLDNAYAGVYRDLKVRDAEKALAEHHAATAAKVAEHEAAQAKRAATLKELRGKAEAYRAGDKIDADTLSKMDQRIAAAEATLAKKEGDHGEMLAGREARRSKLEKDIENARANDTSVADAEAAHMKTKANLDKHEKLLAQREADVSAAKKATDFEFEHGAKLDRDKIAQKIAEGLYKGLRDVQVGNEVHMSRILSGNDLEGLRSHLASKTDLSAGEIMSIVNALKPQEGGEGSIGRLKRRTPLNVHHEFTVMNKVGDREVISAKQFMNRNAYEVLSMYNRQLSAQVALGRLRVENPMWSKDLDGAVPRYLVDGIHSPSQWEDLMSQARAVGDRLGHDPMATAKEVERMTFIYDAIRGTLGATDRGKLGSFLRILRDYNFVRVMNQVGFAQVGETWRLVSEFGIKASMDAMPAYREFVRSARTGQLDDQFAREIEHMASPGTDMIRGKQFMTVDDFGNHVGADGWKSAEIGVKALTHATSLISGMGPLTVYQQRWAAKAAVTRFIYDAEGKMALNMKRMALLGVDKEMAGKIRTEITKNLGTFVDQETGREMKTLNLEKWDPTARHSFEYAIDGWTRRAIHENDVGQLSMVLGSNMGRLMAQFRMFMIGSYAKNTLNALHMRDGVAVSNVLGSTAMAGLLYVAQTYLQSIGRSDQQKFLDKRLSTGAIGAAAFQRAGYSSVAPMGIDIGTFALGLDPLFDARVSGSPSQGIVSNPTVSLFDNAMKATHGIAGAALGRTTYSQQDARALQNSLPFANFLPVVWGANAMMSSLPPRDPQRHQ